MLRQKTERVFLLWECYIVSMLALIFQLPRSSAHIYSKQDYMSTFECDAVSQTGAPANSRSARLTLMPSSAAKWQLSLPCCYVPAEILSVQVGFWGVFFWGVDLVIRLWFSFSLGDSALTQRADAQMAPPGSRVSAALRHQTTSSYRIHSSWSNTQIIYKNYYLLLCITINSELTLLPEQNLQPAVMRWGVSDGSGLLTV